MTASRLPADQAARALISETGTGRTLFVEAGAGTGKTSQLVDRIVNTVVEGGVSLAEIAAITFTEAAASELQARIRVGFEKTLADPERSDLVRERSRQAVADADLATISTVHGFASRLLGEFSVAAGLPPRLAVLDEISSQLAHEHRWDRFVDRVHADQDNAEVLYRAALMEIPLSPRYDGQASFKDVATNFAQNWDRLDGLHPVSGPLSPIDFTAFDAAVENLAAVAATCTDPEDKRYQHIVVECLPSMRALVEVSDPYQKLRLLGRGPSWKKGSGGKVGAWGRSGAEVGAEISAVNDAVGEVVAVNAGEVLDRLMRLTAAEVAAAARERSDDGGLEFHDLLVLARRLLRTSPEVRRTLHERYRHILLDEFQDTDPIQIEVASLIAATPAEEQPEHWSEHPVGDGRLFFVGDPKQSIYRFRRADITLFLEARDAFGDADGAVALSTNFRTVEPIIDWVNSVFADAMPHEIPDAQPRYEPLTAWRRASSGADHRPLVFGGAHPDPKVKAAQLRHAEAVDVAAIVRSVIDRPEDWPVSDEHSGEWRPARLSDVTILIPTRTSLPFLRDALDEQAVPYRLATGTLVYDTQEVRDALASLRAIDDPTDTISLVAALRSPLYGCSDVDLFEYHEAQPRWGLPATAPDSLRADHPVVVAIAHLRSLWNDRWWLGPAAMLERLLRERRAFLLAHGDRRPVEVWRRLRFVLDQARSFEESVGGDLRAFLRWAELQSADGARVHEPMLPETDEVAAQIITVHGSKGLEFPITILSGLTTAAGGFRGGVSVLWGDDGHPEVKLSKRLATAGHEPRADLEEEMDSHEKLRLLYVAATRARDHLAVSGHHKVPKNGAKPSDTFATRLSLFANGRPEMSRVFDPARIGPDAPTLPGLDAGDGAIAPGKGAAAVPSADEVDSVRDAWLAERERLIAAVRRPTSMSATAIAKAADDAVVDVDDDRGGTGPDSGGGQTVRRKGRAGTSIGRAVHATLEVVDFDLDLAAEDGVREIRALVERQCDLETISAQADTVEALVRSALASDTVDLARSSRFHREVYVGTELGSVMVEGYVDLLITTPEGLIVVDYKTDTADTDAQVRSKVATYELQAATYAVALEAVTGLDVVACRFVFCRSGDPVEASVPDLDHAMQRVRSAVETMSGTAE